LVRGLNRQLVQSTAALADLAQGPVDRLLDEVAFVAGLLDDQG
jgi:hypothetical protein